MLDKITLFQNDRTWQQIKSNVYDLVEQDHTHGVSQNGKLIKRLESQLADQFNRKFCITTGCCSDALTISLMALNLPAGSLIAVSNYTFTATAHAVARAGHRVLPIDVDKNYCINIDQIKDCNAVIAVDIFGNMSNWNHLNQLNIPVICDAAQSFESNDGISYSASKGIISCVSFSPSKTISSWGSGGAILTDDPEIAKLVKLLRLHGKENNGQVSINPGLNSMMSSFEAACVLTGLKYSNDWQQRRYDIAKYLISNSKHTSAIDLSLIKHTLHKLVFCSDNRTEILQQFNQANVDCLIHYTTLINDEKLYHTNNIYPVSDKLKSISFTVPNQHTLTDEEVQHIGKLLK